MSKEAAAEPPNVFSQDGVLPEHGHKVIRFGEALCALVCARPQRFTLSILCTHAGGRPALNSATVCLAHACNVIARPTSTSQLLLRAPE